MENKEFDPIENLSFRKNGWIILLIIQGIYLILDVFELSGDKISYGVLSALFMFSLGIIIIVISLINIKNKPIHGFIEGSFYLVFSVIIFYYKYKHFLDFKHTKKELNTTTQKYDKLKEYAVQLQNMNIRLENMNKQFIKKK